MRKDIIKMDREEYRNIIASKDASIDYAMQQKKDCMEKWLAELGKTLELTKELGYLKALFDKEGDTQVIKYNGKLYRIVSSIHFHDVGEADTLDINAVCVDEVG